LPGDLELSSSSTLSCRPWKSTRVAFLLTGSYGGGIGMTSGRSCPDSDTQNAQFHSCHLQPHNNSESSTSPSDTSVDCPRLTGASAVLQSSFIRVDQQYFWFLLSTTTSCRHGASVGRSSRDTVWAGDQRPRAGTPTLSAGSVRRRRRGSPAAARSRARWSSAAVRGMYASPLVR